MDYQPYSEKVNVNVNANAPSPSLLKRYLIIFCKYISIYNFILVIIMFFMVWSLSNNANQILNDAIETIHMYSGLSHELDRVLKLANNSFVKIDTIYDILCKKTGGQLC